MIDYKTELQKLLRELFQFDSADLDFGIYRIMNQKREMIESFIQKDLIEIIDKEYETLLSLGREKFEEELVELKKEIENNLGQTAFQNNVVIKPEFFDLPIVKKYQEKKETLEQQTNIENEITEIFSHLYHFFSRYYSDGDFISKRRYSKKQKYVVPYNGEELLFHWANNDQYYIKSTEWFTKYSFKTTKQKFNFLLRKVKDDIENINVEEKRFFILENDFLELTNDILNIYFSYRALTNEESKKYGKNIKQEKLNEIFINQLFEEISKRYSEKIKLTKKQLQEHLFKYTKRNTSDYFIHKNLEEFLLTELDYYIKNEVLVINFDEADFKNSLTKANVIKRISDKIIDFLAQIEEFQKKLWEKKKFVISTDYLITLDLLDKKYYQEILKNKKQVSEWERIYSFSINEELNKEENKITRYTSNPAIEFFKQNPSICIDTRFFNVKNKYEIINNVENLDSKTNGLLIKSDNFQALNLLHKKFKEKIKCIYIDPPYNTGSDEFLYRDNFQHSSWLSMIYDRLHLAKDFLREDGIIFISINEYEVNNLKTLMDNIFGYNNSIAQIVWENREGGGSSDSKHFKIKHEYILVYAKNRSLLNIKGVSIDNEDRYTQEDEHVKERGRYLLIKLNSASIQYSQSLDYPIKAPDGTEIKPSYGNKKACWRWSKEKVEWGIKNNFIIIKRDINGEWAVYSKQYLNVDNENKPIKRTKRPIGVITKFSSTQASKHLEDLFNKKVFDYSKPYELISHLLSLCTERNDIIMDFFAGSGTTAEAVLQLNAKDNEKRKYILVDFGEYFESVLLSRIQKIIYSLNWKEGKPLDKNNKSSIVNYCKLEQYDDTLNNIEFIENKEIQKTLDSFDDYFINYMLEYETNKTPTKISLKEIINPFNYKLQIIENNEIKPKTIDIIETFNYLLGLNIQKIETFEKDTMYRIIIGEYDSSKIIIIWRNIEDLDLKKDKEFIENELLIENSFDKIYINGISYIKDAILIDEQIPKIMGR